MPDLKLNLTKEQLQQILDSQNRQVIIRKTWACDWDQWLLKKWREFFKKEGE